MIGWNFRDTNEKPLKSDRMVGRFALSVQRALLCAAKLGQEGRTWSACNDWESMLPLFNNDNEIKQARSTLPTYSRPFRRTLTSSRPFPGWHELL
ncbi:hypothetical protein HZ326_22158 [Fusarium oxysporum f. sp. albedinis]|nr:hypothetical protein HZ326_22158 [Fusarium oxysporum f. sp. albedinis]